nr:odorant-binding protein 23 [Peridroma saucia]
MDFWNAQNSLKSHDLGCALVCVFEKNEFLSEDATQLLAANINAFYKASGADDRMSQKMLELIQLCKKSTRTISSLCNKALELAKCFRYGILMMHWAPAPNYWLNKTEFTPGMEPEQVSDDQSLDPTIRSEMNQRRLFATLFRGCRK